MGSKASTEEPHHIPVLTSDTVLWLLKLAPNQSSVCIGEKHVQYPWAQTMFCEGLVCVKAGVEKVSEHLQDEVEQEPPGHPNSST